mmetsp:Transcript_8759/g.26334  ORF Transcript_8759/g.26334 Transcript_8759/m.26334 type:complete len:137 (+) Transcript_8759:157-567(+)|eukprot:CAMPEP_0198730142 /NCGR_PEP_ID=MMETSP1475-20131203/23034_1 /TAXON_ID= ORGANISM="Unidentified sp., Strain CCMP1999" /NCGR_SAMPLE_ID=MMETSP1475 /ASSEMBLY_ACC=CAM_ASM_001111 /LENGTH=136 /DNA_ID=CAMNT_0044492913 /DNA_START=93 /DNA_END=503 /DNA_ORIENTATION=-
MKEGYCVSCGTTSTPMWRAGPEGPKSLCNACGLRWKKGALRLEPAAGNADHGTAAVRPADDLARTTKEKKSTSGGVKTAAGRVAKRSRTSRRGKERNVVSDIVSDVRSKKVFIDFDRYECIFSGLMVVSKFKGAVV